jgi:hypothetical protein
MATKLALVIGADGLPQQLQPGDDLGGINATQTVVSLTNEEASAITIGQAVYVSSTAKCKKAQANANGTSKVRGLVSNATVATNAVATIITDGTLSASTAQWDALTGGTGGLTPGADYFLSAATSGNLTTTAPSTVGQFNCYIGSALSTTVLEVTVQNRIAL